LPAGEFGNKFLTVKPEKLSLGRAGSFAVGQAQYSRAGETATLGLVASRLDQRISFTYAESPDLHGIMVIAVQPFGGAEPSQNPIFNWRCLSRHRFQVEKSSAGKRTQKLIGGIVTAHRPEEHSDSPSFVLPQDQETLKLSDGVWQIRSRHARASRGMRINGQYQSVNFGVTPAAFDRRATQRAFSGRSAFYRPIRRG